MKKIIILSDRFPFPPTSGTKNLLYHYCKILHEKLNMDIINISFAEKDDDIELKPSFISKVYILNNPSGREKIKNLFVLTLLKKRYPMQVSLFYSEKIKHQIIKIVNQEKPDFVFADLIRTAEYLKDFSGFKVIDMQDLFSMRYERQLKMNLDTLNPYGAYLFRLPVLIRKILSVKCIKKMVMKSEIKLLREYEKNIGCCYDKISFVAEREAKIFNKALGENKALAT